MNGTNYRIRDLIIKHLKDELTVEEQLELQAWVALSDENHEIFTRLTIPEVFYEDLQEYHEARINIRRKVDAQIKSPSLIQLPSPTPVRSIRRRMRVIVVAASLILFSIGCFWLASLFRSSSRSRPVSAPVAVQDVAPGGNKATLTLGNGSTIVLENTANGEVAVQGSAHVSKHNDQLSYSSAAGTATASEIEYNTLTTPRGGQYQLTLPDGTKAWLNAASSIRYPTAFVGKDRMVEMSGEIYFEVVHNSERPFKVKTDHQMIEDIGTSFNVNAYKDEPNIKTTLVEGKAKVTMMNRSIDQQVTLKPGQQAQIAQNDPAKIRILNNADIEQIMSWKNGLFVFHNADLQTVLNQLARWYDVEIDYQGIQTTNTLTAVIRRDNMALDVLQVLGASGYHFKIDGRKIKVLP